MSSSGTAAEGEAAPAQPASEKKPDMPSPREESEEEDEDDAGLRLEDSWRELIDGHEVGAARLPHSSPLLRERRALSPLPHSTGPFLGCQAAVIIN